ncbi:MAG: SAM-dependent methyltransferase [Flavobacteriales bacterium]
MSSKAAGKLHLMPVWLGEAGGIEQVPPGNVAVAEQLDLWFVENERTARQFLRRLMPAVELPRMELHRFDQDGTIADARGLVRLMQKGRSAGVMSEAGMPGIADPGALLVRAAHEAGIEVVPHIGPNSMMLALAASGANGQHFTFHGYLPRAAHERKQAIRRIAMDTVRTGAAQLFMETPYRNDVLIADLLEHCDERLLLTVAVDLTQPGGSVRTTTIANWRKQRPILGKRPAVFVLSAA